jgi:hypothetical protein
MYGICQILLMPEHRYRSTCAESPSEAEGPGEGAIITGVAGPGAIA